MGRQKLLKTNWKEWLQTEIRKGRQNIHKNVKKSERIKGRQRGWKWGTKTEHRNGCQETSKVMKKNNRIGIAKNEICGKGRPLSRHSMTPLFSSFYNAFSHEILIFFVRFAHC